MVAMDEKMPLCDVCCVVNKGVVLHYSWWCFLLERV